MLEIASINNEMDMLHPVHICSGITKRSHESLWIILQFGQKNLLLTFKKDTTIRTPPLEKQKTRQMMRKFELGFVEGLFEMYKLRCEIRKARSEIISESVISSYNHKFGLFIFGTHLNFRSSAIENAILPKKLELDLKKKVKHQEYCI